MTRYVLPEPWYKKLWIVKKIIHYWNYLTNSKYRHWCKNPWRPEIKIIKPMAMPAHELQVQPLTKPSFILPLVFRMDINHDTEKKDNRAQATQAIDADRGLDPNLRRPRRRRDETVRYPPRQTDN